eukprot:4196012-Amphidinium_carterae.1
MDPTSQESCDSCQGCLGGIFAKCLCKSLLLLQFRLVVKPQTPLAEERCTPSMDSSLEAFSCDPTDAGTPSKVGVEKLMCRPLLVSFVPWFGSFLRRVARTNNALPKPEEKMLRDKYAFAKVLIENE